MVKLFSTIFDCLILLLFFFWPQDALATLTFSMDRSTINQDDEINLTVNFTVSGGSGKTYYLEGAFKSVNGANYFGQTHNDSSYTPYVSSSNYQSLKAVIPDSNDTWSGNINVKLDTSSSYFSGAGDYTLRLKRFTQAGSASYSDNTENLIVTNQSNTQSSPSPPASNSATTQAATTSDPTPTPSSQSNIFTITQPLSPITSSQSFSTTVTLSLPSYPNTTFYLKAAFAKSGSTNYFGYTKVSNDWVKNSSTYSSQKLITTDSNGSFIGSLEAKPDSADSGFSGSGEYIFKVARYSQSGSGPTWSNESALNINSDLTQTQPSTTPSSSKTSSIQPQPTITPTSSSPNLTKSATIKNQSTSNLHIASVAGVTTESSASISQKQNYISNQSKQGINWYIIAGVLTFLTGGISAGKIIYNHYHHISQTD